MPTPTTDTSSRQPSAEDRQEVLKKKKKKKSKKPHFLVDNRKKNKDDDESWKTFTFFLCPLYKLSFECVIITGRLSRLLKRRAVSNGNNKGGSSAGGNEMASCESPGVYLPTEAQRSPADDWSDWTSFTLELEVHPTTGADGSSLRYISLSPPIDTIRGVYFSFCLGHTHTHRPMYPDPIF